MTGLAMLCSFSFYSFSASLNFSSLFFLSAASIPFLFHLRDFRAWEGMSFFISASSRLSSEGSESDPSELPSSTTSSLTLFSSSMMPYKSSNSYGYFSEWGLHLSPRETISYRILWEE